MVERTSHITAMMSHLDTGETTPWDELLPQVYDELHRLAEKYMRMQRSDHTLQPTALVNEAYFKLSRSKSNRWRSRRHFLAAAALVMRQVLVDHAKGANQKKRGGGQRNIPLDDVVVSLEERSLGLAELNDALDTLAVDDERSSHVVTLRFFGSLNFAEIAEVLNVSESTSQRDWNYARVWLHRKLR
jgi:RNA polymerase sigma-70 factor (ECF subfamily)